MRYRARERKVAIRAHLSLSHISADWLWLTHIIQQPISANVREKQPGLLSLDPHADIGALTPSADWIKCCFSKNFLESF